MKKKIGILWLALFGLVVSGCGAKGNGSSTEGTSIEVSSMQEDSTGAASAEGVSAESISAEENNSATEKASGTTRVSVEFSNRDYEVGYDEEESATILLQGTTAQCSSNAVQISGSTVTITDEGTYILSGNLDDGMIIVNSEKTDKTQLVLDGASIHSETCAPIYILQSDKVFITTTVDSVNELSNGGTFTAIDENNIDAVIFSKEDLTLNGSGTLTIDSSAGHGIVSKDSLTITSGSYEISCASHALSSNDDIGITNGTFTIVSGKDGINAGTELLIAGGDFQVASGDDAFHAEEILEVTAGNIQVTESYEGLEALHILVTGGEISINASDDGLNAAGGADASGMMGEAAGMFGGGMSASSDGSIVIQGGTIHVTAYGDGIDANGTVEITGGHITVCGPVQGDTATLDYDVSGVITGGTFIGTGAAGMAQTFSSSSQGVISVRAGNQSAGTKVSLLDDQGNEILTCEPELDFSVVILSSPEIVTGESYTLTVGTASQTFTAS